MTWVLLSNDDGVDSPALRPFASALGQTLQRDVRVVVPDGERSWTAKAMTRLGSVRVASAGPGVTTVSGLPADAVQLGVHSLFSTPPELVVSGVNLGLNHGRAFMTSSGTVGAAMEGHLAGVRSIAVSTGSAEHRSWRRAVERGDAAHEWRRLTRVAADVVARVLDAQLHDHCDVISVNLPFEATPDTPVEVTSLAPTSYAGIFRRVGDGRFRHDLRDGLRVDGADADGSDVAAFADGRISVTPIRLATSVDVPEDVTRQLHRQFP